MAEQRIAVVTGGAKGIGAAVADRLERDGLTPVVWDIAAPAAPGRGHLACDVSDERAVADAMTATERDHGPIAVLVNNAGLTGPSTTVVETPLAQWQKVQAINLTGTFLCSRAVAGVMVGRGYGRIVNVASGAQNRIDFDNVMLEREFDGGRAYGQSKLAQIMFTFDLAEELAGTGVVVNALHPATFMDTAMVQRARIEPQSTVDEGAEPVMNLITNPEIGTGGYYNQMTLARANAQAYDLDARRQLRELSEELTGAP